MKAIARTDLDNSYARHARAVHPLSIWLCCEWQPAFPGQQYTGHACGHVRQPLGRFRDAVCTPCHRNDQTEDGHGGGKRLQRERKTEVPWYSQRRGPISTINTAPDRLRIPFHDHINADVPDSTRVQYPPTGWKFEIELTYLQTLHVNVWRTQRSLVLHVL